MQALLATGECKLGLARSRCRASSNAIYSVIPASRGLGVGGEKKGTHGEQDRGDVELHGKIFLLCCRSGVRARVRRRVRKRAMELNQKHGWMKG